MKDDKIMILKTMVGSQAHGLASKDSDFDYRGVFIYPTSRILSMRPPKGHTSWIEGDKDDTSWELGKFLLMATKCNPTVLETFLAPRVLSDKERETKNPVFQPTLGDEIQSLFKYVWNSTDVKNAFIGYGLNQRTKFFKNQDNRAPKYATAYLRVLYNAWELLSTGTFTVDMTKTPVFDQLVRFKRGAYEIGEVIQSCFEWETKVLKAYKANPDKKTNIKPIEKFLLKVRKENWT